MDFHSKIQEQFKKFNKGEVVENRNICDSHQLSSDFEKLLSHPDYTDVSFLVGNQDERQRIFAHRLILSARSQVFSSLLYGQMKEATQSEIVIPDVDPDIFKLLLRYLYCGSITVSPETATPLLVLADQYCIEGLKFHCLRFMNDSISEYNVCTLLQHTKLLVLQRQEESKELKELLDNCIQFIRNNPKKVFESEDFVELEEDTLLAVLNDDQLVEVDEVDIFKAALSWGNNRAALLQVPLGKVLKSIIQYIRFPLMKPEDLHSVVKPYVGTTVPYEFYVEALEFQLLSTKITDYDTHRVKPRRQKRFYWEGDQTKFSFGKENLSVMKRDIQNNWGTRVFGNIGFCVGKTEWEITIEHINPDRSGIVIGVTSNKDASYYLRDVGFGMGGNIYGKLIEGSNVSLNTGDKLKLLLDLDDYKLSFFKNNVFSFSLQLEKNVTYYPVAHVYYHKDRISVNFRTGHGRTLSG